MSSGAVGVAIFTLAFTIEIASLLVSTFGGGAGDWDPKSKEQVIAP